MFKFENIFGRSQSKEVKDETKKYDFKNIADELVSEVEYPFNDQRVIEVMGNLVASLEDRLPLYETLLSDDASGRLITLFLRRIINKMRKEENEKNAKISFLASGRYYDDAVDREVKKFVAKNKKNFGKTLLVTELIDSGNSIDKLVKILEEEGVDFDIAALSVILPQTSYKERIKKRLFVGEWGGSSAGSIIYYTPEATGVIKNKSRDGDVTAHPIKYESKNLDADVPKSVRRAREDVKKIADRVYDLISTGSESES